MRIDCPHKSSNHFWVVGYPIETNNIFYEVYIMFLRKLLMTISAMGLVAFGMLAYLQMGQIMALANDIVCFELDCMNGLNYIDVMMLAFTSFACASCFCALFISWDLEE
tara:strand:- start:26 stop:352 length:327 start_codon:yes stop_codon:yes gene_type:complete